MLCFEGEFDMDVGKMFGNLHPEIKGNAHLRLIKTTIEEQIFLNFYKKIIVCLNNEV